MNNSNPSTQSRGLRRFNAYHVLDRDGSKAIWTRIGSAWAHRDGKGFNIQVNVVPLDGRIALREPSADEVRNGGAQ